MSHVIDLTGRTFGRLTVIARDGSTSRGQAQWKCQCECGQQTVAMSAVLRRGDKQSCGCLSRQATGDRSRTHGLSGHSLYAAWKAMNLRCTNPQHPSYADYGGRGISVCLAWQTDFPGFFEWAKSHGWEEGLELDRRDNDGDYQPDNCRFVTRKDQVRNTRANRLIDTPIGRITIAEAAEKAGVSFGCIKRRINSGWPAEHLFAPPSTGGRRPF